MKTILFDLDGTLLDTLTDLSESVNHTMKCLSLPERGKDEVRRFVGNGIRNLIRLATDSEEEALLSKALEIYSAHYTLHANDHTAPYPKIKDLICRLLAEERRVAVVSNKPNDAVLDLVKCHFPQISHAIGQRENLKRKPWPDMLFSIMEEMGEKKENCILVGDSEVDVLTAQNAGIPCISVTWGFREERDLREAGGKIFAHTADELYERILYLE